jgi:YVTN family beta-propeller protein
MLCAANASAISGGTVYVCNYGDDTVSAVSLDTLTVAKTIPVGTGPGFVIVTPDGTKAYVANRVGNSISVIRTSTDIVVATIPVGVQPMQIAVSRDSRRVYVANRGSATISMIDTSSDTVITNVPTVHSGPTTLAFHPVRDELWIGYNSGLGGGGTIEARSATDLSVLASTSSTWAYYASADLAFLSDGSEVFGAEGCGWCGRYNRIVGSYSDGSIPIIGGPIGEDNKGAALAVAVNPVNNLAYFAKLGQNGGPNKIMEYQGHPTPGFGRTLTFSAPPADLVVTPDGSSIFVANQATSGFITIVDTASFTTVATVNVGNQPMGIAIKTAPSLRINMYAGLTITGSVGDTCTVQCTTSLPSTNWQPLATFTLPTSPYLYVDTNSVAYPNRFYRVISP